MKLDKPLRIAAATALAITVGITALKGGKSAKKEDANTKGGDRRVEEPEIPRKNADVQADEPKGEKALRPEIEPQQKDRSVVEPRIINGIEQIEKNIATDTGLIERWEAELNRIRTAKPQDGDVIGSQRREQDLRGLIAGARRSIAENIAAKRRLEEGDKTAADADRDRVVEPADSRRPKATIPAEPKEGRVWEPTFPKAQATPPKAVAPERKGPLAAPPDLPKPRSYDPERSGPLAGPRDELREPRAVEPREDAPRGGPVFAPPPLRPLTPTEEPPRRPDPVPPKEIPSRVLTPEEQRAFDEAFEKGPTIDFGGGKVRDNDRRGSTGSRVLSPEEQDAFDKAFKGKERK